MLKRKELVERWVEQADRDGPSGHLVEDLGEVVALEIAKAVQRLVQVAASRLEIGAGLAFLGHAPHLGLAPPRGRDEHAPHELGAVLPEEHVLRTAEADALRPQLPRLASVRGGVGVRPDPEPARPVRPLEYPGKVVAHLGLDQGNLVDGHAARRAFDGDDVPRGKLSLPIQTVPEPSSTFTSDAPATHGRPIPRATSAA